MNTTIFGDVLSRETETILNVDDIIVMIKFMFKRIKAVEFGKYIKSRFGMSGAESIQIRNDMERNGYFLFHLKPYLFYCFKNNIRKKRKCMALARRFSIRGRDAKLVQFMFSDEIQNALAPIKDYPALRPKRIIAQVDRIISEVRGYTQKFVRRKHSFIVKNPHNAITFDDIASELISHGIQHVMLTYPKIQSTLHATNIAKRAIHNNGINYINSMTRQCRANTQRDDNGEFYSTVIAINTEVQKSMESEFADDDYQQKIESLLTCQSLLSSYSGKKQQALRILFGFYDAEFSKWLMENGKYESHRQRNDYLYEDLLRRGSTNWYFGYMAHHFKVSKSKIIQLGYDAAKKIAA